MTKKITKIFCIIVFLITLNFNYVLAQDIDFNRLNEVINIINSNYKDNVSNEQLINGAIKGMLNTLDPHSYYLSKQEYNNMLDSLNGDFSGIGVSIKKNDKYIEVIEIIKNSPSEKVGIKKGDKFVSVDGEDVIDIEIDIFVSKVRGPKGSKVKVGIIRQGLNEPIYYEIIRDDISMEYVEYEIIEENIGLIKISSFSDNSSRQFVGALKEFDNKNIKNIIVDLRGNPGGYLSSVIEMCRYIIPKGPIVHIKQNGSKLETYSSRLDKSKYNVVVLVDGGSASASEIFAGAVQDTKSGTVIGTKTYGKGTVQTFFKLNGGDYIKLSIANYLTPNKRSIDGVGLTPDIVIENIPGLRDIEEVDITRNIYLGKKGQDVMQTEKMLYELGYITNKPDSVYDKETTNGVIEFKKENNLLQNNVISIMAQKLLKSQYESESKIDKQLNKAIEILKN